MKPKSNSHERAKILRRDMTEAEKIIWSLVRAKSMGFKFRRQNPVDHYIVDFVCIELGLIIEIDGGQHNEEVDRERTTHLQNRGYKILRFWNNDVIQNKEGVYSVIEKAIMNGCGENPLPDPLPERERE